jgi:hypothetical protein
MTMIIATLAWAFAAFVILHDNARTRRDLRAYQGQFDGNMKSFWSRLFEGEKKIAATVKSLSELAIKAGMEDRKLEEKSFFEINELREALAQNVDNMADRNAAVEFALGEQSTRISTLFANTQDLMIAELARQNKKKKMPVVKTRSNKGSRARA